MARLVTISKVSVSNLPLTWLAGWEKRYFKVVIRCAGLEVGATRPEQLDTVGCIKWAETLQLSTHGKNETFVAIVVSSRTFGGDSWCLVPGCRFESISVKEGHSVWRPPFAQPGAGPTLCAELATVLDGDKSQGSAGPSPASGHKTHEMVDPYLVTAGSAGTDKPRTVLVSARDPKNNWRARTESLNVAPAQGMALLCSSPTPAPRPPLSVQTPTLVPKGGSISARGRDGNTEESKSESAAVSSFPGADTRGIAQQRTGGGPVPKQLNASVLKPSLSGASDWPRVGSLGSSALRLPEAHFYTFLVNGDSFRSGKPSIYSCGTTQDGCGTTAWTGLASDGMKTEEKGQINLRNTAWHGMDNRRMRWCGTQPAKESEGTTSADVPYPSMGIGERNTDQQLRLGVNMSQAVKPRSGEPARHAVNTSSTVSQSTAPTHATAPRSDEEDMQVKGDETRAPGADLHLPPELLCTPGSPVHPSLFALTGVEGDVKSSSVDPAKDLLSTGQSSTFEDHATCVPGHVLIPSEETPFHTETLMQRGKPSSAEIRRPHDSVSHVTAVARAPPPWAVESTPHFQTRTVQLPEIPASIGGADRVYFTCVSPRSVSAGCEFQLRVSASFLKVPDGPSGGELQERGKEGAIEAGMSASNMVERNTRVTVNLELPVRVFKVLEPTTANAGSTTASQASTARDFVRNGIGQDTMFRVVCLPGVAPGAVDCRVRFVEGSSATCVSFRIEVEQASRTSDTSQADGRAAADERDRAFKAIFGNVAEDDPSEPAISDAARARPPAALRLARHVTPGPSAHESKEHGFRLTVQDGSLHSPIGPITVQQFAQVVECENDGQAYLAKTVVDCQPCGIKFPDKPLWMDFILKGASSTNISETFQVLVCKGEGEGWRKVKSEVRHDEWGTYLRATVSHFSFFTCGRKVHPSDPARLEDSDQKDMIEVENATAVELFFVLVPVVFDSDRTSSVTYTGTIGFGAAGVSLQAGLGSGSASVVKCHLLPAGFTADDVSVAAGGNFFFYPPANSTEGKLLIATISEDSQADLPGKVVVLHGKFITPAGRRRVILPMFLQSKSRISARLGPDDVPVNMVMIMAGMGSKSTSSTLTSSPPQDALLVEVRPIPGSGEPHSAVESTAVPPPVTPGRGGTTQSCVIS